MNKFIFKVLVSILLILLLFILVKPIGRVLFPIKYSQFINEYSAKYNLDSYLIVAIIKTESNFQDDAKSNKNAIGLMQITPETGRWIASKHKIKNFNEEMLLDKETNIKFGCWYIRDLYNEFNDNLDNVLAAYNGGRGNVNKWLQDESYSKDGKVLQVIPFKETAQYVKKVEFYFNLYKFLYKDSA